MNWYIKCIKQYADFSGRARRKEYWMFTLFNALIAFVLGLVLGVFEVITGTEFISTAISAIYSLFIFIPSLAVCIRRLHDVGKSGWFYLIGSGTLGVYDLSTYLGFGRSSLECGS